MATTTDIELKIWFRMLILWSVLKPAIFDNECTIPSNILLKENVPKDTVIYEFSRGIWAIDNAEPPGYLEVGEVNSSYYIKTTKDLDLEEMKRRYIFVILRCNERNDIALSVYIQQKNEFQPRFTESSYKVSVMENAVLGTVVFRAADYSTDKDFQQFLIFSMKLHNIESSIALKDQKFRMNDSLAGTVCVVDHLNFEVENQYIFDIKVEDSSFSNTAKLIIDVEDIDDLGPVFIEQNVNSSSELSKGLPIYYYRIQYNYTGEITVLPEPVKAVDTEKEHYNVKYSLEIAMPPQLIYYFAIDSNMGNMSLIKLLTANSSAPGIIIIKAEDVSSLAHSSIAALFVSVEAPIPRIQRIMYPQYSKGVSEDVFIGVLTIMIFAMISFLVAIIYIIISCTKSKKDDRLRHYVVGGLNDEESQPK